MKLKGFTLAEVLIALVIIGVVAAITVPIIIANSQEQAIKSALKKNYSVLQQALQRYYVDNGEHYIFDEEYTIYDHYRFREEFILKYFNVAKDCSIVDCNLGDFEYKNYAGNKKSIYDNSNGYDSMVILQDGSILDYGWGGGRAILIDVNGAKNPNTLGKDFFYFEYDESVGVYIPGGSKGVKENPNFCDKQNSSSSSGIGCTAKVLGKY